MIRYRAVPALFLYLAFAACGSGEADPGAVPAGGAPPPGPPAVDRDAEEPPEARAAPLIGPRLELPPERIRELAAELEARMEEEQAIRLEVMKGMRPGGPTPPDPDLMRRMRKVDVENTAWLRELVSEVGWIDTERFGAAAAEAAFLIVQHSGDLALMRAALPEMEKNVKAGGGGASAYALLFDRVQLMSGRKQRYGTQLMMNPMTGEPVVSPLEDEEKVDEYRAEVGLPPLQAYLDQVKEMAGAMKPPGVGGPPEPKEKPEKRE